MAALPWQTYTERMVGKGHPSLADTNNRALREFLRNAGLDPDSVNISVPSFSQTVNAGSNAFTGTKEARITAAIALALSLGWTAVYIPIKAWDGTAMLPYNASLVTFNTNVQMLREGGPSAQEGVDTVAYGAAWNDAQDDTTAITAAFNFAAQQRFASLGPGLSRVFGGLGIARVSSTLTIPNGVQFVGFGRSVTEVKASGLWTNPTPNCIVRLGPAGAPVFACRIENMTVNAQGQAGIVNVYGESLQTQAGAKNVLARAFGAAGFQTRIGSGSAPLTNNDYELSFCEALNGISATGIGFDLDAGTGGTFSPTLIGLSHSNATFPGGPCPAGFKFQNGPFYSYRLATEWAVDGVLFSTLSAGGVYGVHGNNCTNVITHGSNRVIACGVSRSAGTNTINDTTGPDSQRTSIFVGFYTNSGDTGGADDGLVLSRGAVHVQRTNAALAIGNNNNYSIFDRATGRLTADAGGSAITGLQSGSPGQQMRLFKVGGGTLTMTNNDAASSAANRILTPTGATITITWCVNLEYDGTTSQWRVVSFV